MDFLIRLIYIYLYMSGGYFVATSMLGALNKDNYIRYTLCVFFWPAMLQTLAMELGKKIYYMLFFRSEK